MGNPPITLTPEEQKIVARTRKARQFFVLLRARRHALLAPALQDTLAQAYRPEPGGTAPVEAGVLALARLWQAYGHVSDRDAVALTVLDKRWQRVLDGLDAEPPPCSQGTLGNLRRRLLPHNLDKPLRERTVALAEQTGGFGARQWRAVLESPPRRGAGRVEDPCNLLGPARRTIVGLAAQELDTSVDAIVADPGLRLVGHSRLQAALELAGGAPTARAPALGLVLEEGERWQRWLEPQSPLSASEPPRQERMETMAHVVAQATEPAPAGGPGGRRLKTHGVPDRRLALEAQDRRHGRTSSAKPCNGFQEPCAVAVESTVTREVVGRPAHAPAPAVGELLAEALERRPGLLQRASALGDMASPRMAQWAEPGVDIIARPWPQVGPLFPKHAFTLACAGRQGTCPGGQTVPMVPGQPAQLPATAGDACAWRTQGTTATHGQGRSVHIREDEQCQQKLRAKMKPPRGRAALRQRTAVEHALAHQWAHQGRRARDKGLRKNQCDGRRHAAVSNLQRAARDEEEHRLGS